MKFAVFVSGSGTNLQAIIDAVQAGQIAAELALVVSDREDAFGLQRAESAGIKTMVFSPKNYTNPQSVDRDIAAHLKQQEIDFIVLAGYMRLLTEFFVKEFPRKILNIHPALLPSFKGMHGIKDAFTYGVKVTGVTVHFVDSGVDTGPIILQKKVPILPGDTLETLEARVHQVEYEIYPEALKRVLSGKIQF